MIFNIDNQVSFPLYRMLDSVNKNGDNEIMHSILVYCSQKDLTNESKNFMTDLVGQSRLFELSVSQNDENIWSFIGEARVENFYIEISTENEGNSKDDVVLTFIVL